MIKQVLIALGVSGIIFGCQDIKYPERPDNLIDSQTMVNIYTDSYLANASKRFNRTILLRQGVDLEGYIYKKYGIDSLQFEQSNAFYTADIDEYRKMMVQVKDSIDARLVVVDTIVAREKRAKQRQRDSLRKLAEKRRDSTGIKVPDSLLADINERQDELDSVPPRARKVLQGQLLKDSAKDSIR